MNIQSIKITLGIFMSLFITACTDSGGDITAGIGGSGKVASGSITGFGSVFVNGVEYETDSAIFDIDGNSDGSEMDLAIGMIVDVSGIINADGITGTASKIEFNEQVQGPVELLSAINADGTSRSFYVLGTKVIVDSTSTVFDNFVFSTIADNNNVEVSGFYDSSNNLLATRVELKELVFTASSLVEVKGKITALTGLNFTLGLGGIEVEAIDSEFIDLPSGLVEGVFVEVKGNYDSASNTITAKRVEAEDNDFDDTDEFEIEGIITNYIRDDSFNINGIPVNASGAIKEPVALMLSDDIRIEAEGKIVGGVLIATEVKAREGSVEIHAPVTSVNSSANSFEVTPVISSAPITVIITSSTRLNDDVNSIEPFSLNNLEVDDFVEVEAFIDSSGDIVATEVEVKELSDVIVQATIESGATPGTVKVLGVEFIIQDPGETSFEDADDIDIPQATFYSSIILDSTLIKVKDEKPANGTANEIELETP